METNNTTQFLKDDFDDFLTHKTIKVVLVLYVLTYEAYVKIMMISSLNNCVPLVHVSQRF